jgi:hypothetical protein
VDGDDSSIVQDQELLDLTPEKYDVCILKIVMNGVDIGKESIILMI